MKYIKLLTIALATTSMVACSDDDANWNSASDVTVSMAQTEISVKENKGIFNVPVSVEGEANGPIQVTVEVAEVGENPAMDDVHYLVTSKTIVIPADATTGNIEISTVDNGEINEARQFDITIVSVEGAQVGANITTTVNLKDNDAAFYEKLQGNWTLTTALGDSWPVQVVGYEEGEEGYDETLYIIGMMGYSWTQLEVSYKYDVATNQGTLEIPYGRLFAEGVNFSGLGVMDVYAAGGSISPTGSVTPILSGSTLGTWSDDFKQITFAENDYIFAWVVDPASGNIMGFWDYFVGIKLSR